LEPILDRIATDRSIVICPMIDAISDKTLEFSRQGGLAIGGFTWSLHFTWRSIPQREQQNRKSDADPARYTSSMVYFTDRSSYPSTCLYFDGRFPGEPG